MRLRLPGLLVLSLLAACEAPVPMRLAAPATAAPPGTVFETGVHVVTIGPGGVFTPARVWVRPGAATRFVNADTKPHTVALVRSKLKSSRCILCSAIAVWTKAGTPPWMLWMMKPMANSAPPNITNTCTKSVQITAFMPPSVVYRMVNTPMISTLHTTSMPVMVAIANAGRNRITLMRLPICITMHSALASMRMAGWKRVSR